MKLTVIGHWGGYPEAGGATSCYLLESNGISIVLDFGSGALSKFQQIKQVEELDAVLISHYHADHIADIGVLQYAMLVRAKILGLDKKIPIYGHGLDQPEFLKLSHDNTVGIEYNVNKVLKIGPFTIDFTKTTHGVPCYAMRIKDEKHTLVYTADTAYNPCLESLARGADILIADCNFYAGMNAGASGHMTSRECGLLAENAGVKTLLLSHLPQFGNLNQLVREAERVFAGEVLLASNGLTWGNR